ncbi:hypothetical protein BS78_09G078000, partial [Paspalum vaginatum]
MIGPNIDLLCRNVRELNLPARRDVMHETIAATVCHIVCLRETKLSSIDAPTASYLGGHRLTSFAHKPAGGLSGTRGGILLLWNDNFVELSNLVVREFHISAMVTVRETNDAFLLTTVYGPSRFSRKHAFLQEVSRIKP